MTDPKPPDAPEPPLEILVEDTTPTLRQGPIPEHLLHAIALMSLNLVPTADIATAAGLKVDAVGRLLAGENTKYNELLDGYRKKILNTTSTHQLHLADLIEKAYGAVERALVQNTDLRLAKDTGFEVMDRVLPNRAERLADAPSTNISVALQTNILQTEVNTGIKSIIGQFGELVEAVTSQDPERHVKTGAEALPRSAAAATIANTTVEPVEAVNPEDLQ